jgi:hypothetical protein
MTSATATHRYSFFIVLLLFAAGCGHPPAAVAFRAVELTHIYDRAQRRPAAGFDLTVHVADGIARPSIVMPVPARAIWSLPLPRRGVFRAFVAIDPAGAGAGTPATAVRFRLGVGDARVYEGLADCTLTGERGWTEFRADLSAFAGIKWSLFYRPDRIAWRIVLATDVVGGGPTRAVWGSPEILTDIPSAREYATRRLRVH